MSKGRTVRTKIALIVGHLWDKLSKSRTNVGQMPIPIEIWVISVNDKYTKLDQQNLDLRHVKDVSKTL